MVTDLVFVFPVHNPVGSFAFILLLLLVYFLVLVLPQYRASEVEKVQQKSNKEY